MKLATSFFIGLVCLVYLVLLGFAVRDQYDSFQFGKCCTEDCTLRECRSRCSKASASIGLSDCCRGECCDGLRSGDLVFNGSKIGDVIYFKLTPEDDPDHGTLWTCEPSFVMDQSGGWRPIRYKDWVFLSKLGASPGDISFQIPERFLAKQEE